MASFHTAAETKPSTQMFWGLGAGLRWSSQVAAGGCVAGDAALVVGHRRPQPNTGTGKAPQLNWQMDDVDKEIEDLFQLIKSYGTEYKTASAERRRVLGQAVFSSTEALNQLWDKKKAQSGGLSRGISGGTSGGFTSLKSLSFLEF